MAARLTFEDVRNGRAIPQPGDWVGPYVYTGGDPSDPSLYQPQAQNGVMPPSLSGSVFDPDNLKTQTVQAGAPQSSAAAPTLSGVKMLLPDIPNPLSLPSGSVQFPPAFGQPPRSPANGISAAAQDFGANPGRFPPARWQPTPPSRTPVVPVADGGSSNWIGGRSVDPVQQAHDTVQRVRDAAVNWSESKVGSGDYRYFGENPDVGGRSGKYLSGRGAAKCNIFAGDAYGAAGVNLRDPTNSQVYLRANVWGDPTSKIPGFVPITDNKLQRGDILSNGDHVTIYDPGPNNEAETISAADWWDDNKVVHNDWGFRGTEGGKPIVVWRYIGPPQQSKVPAYSPRQSKVPY